MKKYVADLSGGAKVVDMTPAEAAARQAEESAWPAKQVAQDLSANKKKALGLAVDALLEELLSARAKDADAPQAVKDYAATLP